MTEARGKQGDRGTGFGELQGKGSWPQDAREGGGFRSGEWNEHRARKNAVGPTLN